MAAPIQRIRGPHLVILARQSYCELDRISGFEAHLMVNDISRIYDKNHLPSISGLREACEQAFRSGKKTGLVLASNRRMVLARTNTNFEWLKEAFPCWTGTMTAYVEPDTPFNKSKLFSKNDNALVYDGAYIKERWLFLLSAVPEHYLSTPNAILLTDHPDYSLEIKRKRGRTVVVQPNTVDLFPDFPPCGHCWYDVDQKYGIPSGRILAPSSSSSPPHPGAVYLLRLDGGRIGLLARGFHEIILNAKDYYDWRLPWVTRRVLVDYLSGKPSDGFGVVVESP